GSNVSGNQSLMLEEQLRAQRDAALRLGFSEQEIERLQRTTRFNRAEDFLRVGQKSKALQLITNNLRGVRSARVSAKLLLRLLIPNSFMRGRARYRQKKTFERYGRL
ncbi:MAG TPA: hypothetical protein VHR36_08810, partial [Pyrinomonadaceae bacterium]|nr:hypothetical protein [Pyrinomonadaceae bacterium]